MLPLPHIAPCHALTVARLYSGYAILVEPPKTTFGRARSAAARPHAPLPTPPRNRCANLLGKVGGEQDDARVALQLVTGLRCFIPERCRCCAHKPQTQNAPNPGSRNRYERFRRTNRGMTA